MDDALARCLEEQGRRSRVMVESMAQWHHGVSVRDCGHLSDDREPDCTDTQHIWIHMTDEDGGLRLLFCEGCMATVPPPVVALGEQMIPLNPE